VTGERDGLVAMLSRACSCALGTRRGDAMHWDRSCNATMHLVRRETLWDMLMAGVGVG
jgi:hypothetical protein